MSETSASTVSEWRISEPTHDMSRVALLHVLRRIRGASAAPFRASPRVLKSQHLIPWNLLLLQHDHVRPLPTQGLDSCSLLTTQLSVLPKIW